MNILHPSASGPWRFEKRFLTKFTLFSIFTYFLFQSSFGFAQTKGKVVFDILPTSSIIKIGDESVTKSATESIELNQGEYVISIWAPDMKTVIDTIQVEAGKTINYKRRLITISDSYRNYQIQLQEYNAKKIKNIALGGLVVAGNLALIYWNTTEKDAAFDEIKTEASTAISAYSVAINESEAQLALDAYAELKDKFDKEKSAINNNRLLKYSSLALSAGLSTYYFIKKSKKKLSKPTYKQESSFSSISPKIRPSFAFNHNEVQLGTTILF